MKISKLNVTISIIMYLTLVGMFATLEFIYDVVVNGDLISFYVLIISALLIFLMSISAEDYRKKSSPNGSSRNKRQPKHS